MADLPEQAVSGLVGWWQVVVGFNVTWINKVAPKERRLKQRQKHIPATNPPFMKVIMLSMASCV